jgi:hypothetical protein
MFRKGDDMKKKVERETTVCDVCGKSCFEFCLGCGADHCDAHMDELGVRYRYSIYSGGYMDGYYCLDCDTRLRASGEDPLHTAYVTLKALIDEYNAFFADFTPRADKVEKRIETLWEARRKEKQDE